MFIHPLQRHLNVCAQVDLPTFVKRDPGFWNVISIREPFRPVPNPVGFRRVHTMICLDIVGTDGLADEELTHIPRAKHLEEVFAFSDSMPTEPLLVHCWAGVSRSTSVALALIARAMTDDGYSEDEMVQEACGYLLAIRPHAAPNPLVLQLGLTLFLDSKIAQHLTRRLVNHPGLFQNRHNGASPAG